jgi:hypothetical protein
VKGLLLKAVFVGAVTALAWFSVPVAIVAICASVLAALHDKASSIIELSFGPLKAKLERELTDAEQLLDRLKSFAAVQARAAIAASAHTGRFSAANDWIFASAKRLEEALKAIGASSDQIRESRSDLIQLTLLDAGHAATGGNIVPMHLAKEAQVEWKTARDQKLFSDPEYTEGWLRKQGQFTSERQKILDDMRWIIANGDIQNSEQYLRVRTPVEWRP